MLALRNHIGCMSSINRIDKSLALHRTARSGIKLKRTPSGAILLHSLFPAAPYEWPLSACGVTVRFWPTAVILAQQHDPLPPPRPPIISPPRRLTNKERPPGCCTLTCAAHYDHDKVSSSLHLLRLFQPQHGDLIRAGAAAG